MEGVSGFVQLTEPAARILVGGNAPRRAWTTESWLSLQRSNLSRIKCPAHLLWDGVPPMGPRHAKRTGALLVSTDTSTGACARSCKRGSSLHSDPSRWETGQVKLLRRPMDRHFHHQKHIYSFSASCPKKKTQKRKYTSNLFAASSRDNAASTLWRYEREMRSSTGSPHQMHIASSAKKKRTCRRSTILRH